MNGVVTAYGYEEGTDRLTSYGEETIEYDGMGNPTSYRGVTATWEKGRQLKSIADETGTVTFGYDVFGLRNQKTAGGETTNYVYENGKLLRQTTGSEVMTFIYGSEGIIGFRLGTSRYLYRKNVFGDVEEIYSAEGMLVGKYSYTAFGECEIETDENGIATKNPIRYRGYYFDEETGFYYLKTRYYDPVVGRFITIDDVSYLAPDTINGLNLYAYCGNNPVMNVDPNGHFFFSALFLGLLIGGIAGGIVGGVTAAVNGGNILAGIGKGLLVGAAFGAGIGLGVGLIGVGGSMAFAGGGILKALGGVATIAVGIAALGIVGNNLANFIYYTFISDGVSDLTPTSYSGVNGDDSKYLSRWDRLDYAKAQTGEKWYNWNAWRYYSEYSLHMYGWFALKEYYQEGVQSGLAGLANSVRSADVFSDRWDSRVVINILTFLFGLLGI